MVIGEAPGEREDDINRPFSGSSGKYLDEVFEKYGIDRSECYITNMVKCRPPHNRTPLSSEIKACRKYLTMELETVKPKFVLLLGSTAMELVYKEDKITSCRGKQVEKDGIIYYITYHPAATKYNPNLKDVFEKDIIGFSTIIGARRNPELNMKIVDNFDNFLELLEKIKDSNEFYYDIETTCLNKKKGDINCMGFGFPDAQFIVPVKLGRFSRSQIILERMMKLIFQFSQDKNIIMHNGKFDNNWTYEKFGERFGMTFDTILAAHVLDENRSMSLKNLAPIILGVPPWDVGKASKIKKINKPQLYEYCARDVMYTGMLYQVFKEQLTEDPLLHRLFYKLSMRAEHLFEHVERRGVFVQQEKLDIVDKKLSAQLVELRQKLKEFKDINWNSNPQINQYFFEDLGLTVLEYTEGGKPSTKESVLMEMRGMHPSVDILLEYRGISKQHGTFVEGWKREMVNSRLYCSFNLTGTVTRRLSSSEPNLQQVPRDPLIRSIIGAPPGWVFVQADLGQIELRGVAILSGDRKMTEIFSTEGDIHTTTARAVTGESGDNLEGFAKKEWRKKAKAVNFGFVYGMGSKKFKDYAKEKYQVELTEDEAAEFRKKYFDLYADIREWHKKQTRLARRFKRVRYLSGALRRLPDVDSDDFKLAREAERQAINSPVQGFFSGDFPLMAAVELDEAFEMEPERTAYIVGMVHDSILLEVKEEYLEEKLRLVEKTMNHPAMLDEFEIDLPIPIVTDIEIGSWGEGKKWKE